MSWDSLDYQLCLQNNPYGRGPLDAQDYCDAMRWVNEPPGTIISMGERTLPVQLSWPGIPQVATGTPFPPQVGIFEQSDRRDQPSDEGSLPVSGAGQLVILGDGAAPNTTRVMKGKIIYTILSEQVEAIRNRPFMSNEVPTASGPGPGTPAYLPPVIDSEEEPVSTIIDAIVDLGTAYFAGQQPTQQPMPLASPGATVNVGAAPAAQPYQSICPTDSGSKGMIWDPNANCGAGKWIKRRKRRRQRLATASDIKDIGALKSVLGPKALGAWIATH